MENNKNIFANRDVARLESNPLIPKRLDKDDWLIGMGYKQADKNRKKDAINAMKAVDLTPMDGVLSYEDPMLLNQIKKLMNSNIEKAKNDGIIVESDYYKTPKINPTYQFDRYTSDPERTPYYTGKWMQYNQVPVSFQNKFTGNITNKPPSFPLNFFYNKLYDEDNRKVAVNVPRTPSLENLFIMNEELAHAYNELDPREKGRGYSVKKVGPLAEMTNQIYEEIDAKDKAYRNTLKQLGLSSNSRLTPDADTAIDDSFNSYIDALRHRVYNEQLSYDQSNIKDSMNEMFSAFPRNYLTKPAYQYYNTTPEKFAKENFPNLLYPWWSNEDYNNFIPSKKPPFLGIPTGNWNPHLYRWQGVNKEDIKNFPETNYLDEYIVPPMSINSGQIGKGYFSKNHMPPIPYKQ